MYWIRAASTYSAIFLCSFYELWSFPSLGLVFFCMAILIGTTFYDVGTEQSQVQETIARPLNYSPAHRISQVQDRFSAHFFAVAFLCFMVNTKQKPKKKSQNINIFILSFFSFFPIFSLPIITVWI